MYLNQKEMNLKSSVIDLIMRVERRFCPHYCGIVDRRRVIAFLLLTLCECLLIPFHLILFLWLKEPWGLSLTLSYTLLFGCLQYAIWMRKLPFGRGVAYFYLLMFLKLSVDSVFSTIFGNSQDSLSVISNVFIMFILSITALSQLLYRTSLIISIGLIPVIVSYFAHNPLLFSLCSAKAILVGFMVNIYVAIYNMSVVTKGLRQPRRVTQMEQKALNMLAELKESNDARAGNLIERLNPDLRQKVIAKASEHLRKEEFENIVWDKLSDDLTNSEKEICKLVLQGKTLKEICVQLNKSESNITSQRCHIRKKLNMDRKDALKRTLELRLSQIRESTSA